MRYRWSIGHRLTNAEPPVSFSFGTIYLPDFRLPLYSMCLTADDIDIDADDDDDDDNDDDDDCDDDVKEDDGEGDDRCNDDDVYTMTMMTI